MTLGVHKSKYLFVKMSGKTATPKQLFNITERKAGPKCSVDETDIVQWIEVVTANITPCVSKISGYACNSVSRCVLLLDWRISSGQQVPALNCSILTGGEHKRRS